MSKNNDVLELSYIETQSIDECVNLYNSKNVTDPVMTPYEYARLISIRAKQLACGCPPKIEWTDIFDPLAIAKCEMDQRVLPMVIQRYIPDSSKLEGYRVEEYTLKELDICDY